MIEDSNKNKPICAVTIDHKNQCIVIDKKLWEAQEKKRMEDPHYRFLKLLREFY